MKSLRLFSLAIVLLFFTVSCTEKIDLKLKNDEPQLVIEGKVTDEHYAGVFITESMRFNEALTYKSVQNATVIISDDAGNADTLFQEYDGFYRSYNIQGTSGRTYFLKVYHNGITYEAASTMPYAVPVDSLTVEETFGNFADPESKRLRGVCHFADPAGIRNFYKVEAIRNGQYQYSKFVSSDRLWDGKIRTFNVPSDTLAVGDTLTARLISIDRNVFEYFLVLRNLGSQLNQPAAPANPTTNIAPPTLGYFSAHAVRTATVVVK